MADKSINYKTIELQMEAEAKERFTHQLKDQVETAQNDSLRHTVLLKVAQENYEGALIELREYVTLKPAFPDFQSRVRPYVKYSVDIIHAIRAKRMMLGATVASSSKQAELFERVSAHFDELKFYLKKMELAYAESRLNDIRSTVWVLKTLFYSLFVVFGILFIKEIGFGLSDSVSVILNQFLERASNFVVSILP